jgi:DNA-binding XRE family transcriptional regulator
MGKNRLRVFRAERRMTQLTLARRARINVARISFIENGHVEPKPKEQSRIARVLNTDVAEIFPDSGSEAIAS